MKKWFVLAIFTSLIGASFAQDKPTAKKEQQVKGRQSASGSQVKQVAKKPPTVKFSMEMIESGRFDPGYLGFEVSEVVDAIEKRAVGKKGEFETTADYIARKAVEFSGKLLGDSSMRDPFAFVFPVGKARLSGEFYNDGLTYEFDADRSEARLYIRPKSWSGNGIGAPDYETNKRATSGLDQFDLAGRTDLSSTYQASNAYGATVSVEKRASTMWGIAANRIRFLSSNNRATVNSKPVARFIIENSKAARELPAMKALMVMKITDPPIVYNFFSSKPTREDPKDMSIQQKYLTGDMLGIVFYSDLTGEIFARVPDSFGKPEVVLAPGTIFKDCSDCPEMVVVPPGSFEMGSPASETGRRDNEGPQHRVTIGKAFALGKYEVTVGEFRRFVQATNYRTDAEKNRPAKEGCFAFDKSKSKSDFIKGLYWDKPDYPITDKQPAACLSWNDAQAYVEWLVTITGKPYRLPSEAEWEYAARAGTTTAYPWGDSPDQACRYANVTDDTADPTGRGAKDRHDCNDGYRYSAPVGNYEANAFGLHDMIGNVSEWVEDCRNDSYSGAPSDGSAWISGDCSFRTARGGGALFKANAVRSGYRSRASKEFNSNASGLRLARDRP